MCAMKKQGAYAAAAEAQLTGRPGCCAGSSGPGHVHLINGLYDAHRSGAPVIAIASTIPTGEFGTEYFQETNTIKLFNDCSYYNEVATTPKQFPRMLQSAIQTAVTRKGVSVIGLPGDLAKASAVAVDSSVQGNYPAPPEVCPSEEGFGSIGRLTKQTYTYHSFLRHRLPGSSRGSNRAFREAECSGGIYFQRKDGGAI